jgi:pimeloyl-ACP methyl ester carboxylesterase
MSFTSIVSVGFLLLQLVASHSTEVKCTDFIIPVHVVAPSYPLLLPPLTNGFEATELLLEAEKRDANPNTTSLLGPPVNITTTYTIGATYCAPSNRTKGIVQFLTHGIGFERSYWNLDGELNYQAAATAAGYATFFYDRIGTGLSSHPDPYTIVQVPTELAILVELTKLLKDGKISPKIPKPKKVVHVGHSYGSMLTNGLVASFPDLSDGIILTGFSHVYTYQRWFAISTGFHLARENQPAKFGNLSTGYLTWGDLYYNQYSFLKYPYFDVSVLQKAEAGKQTFTVGQLLTFILAPVLSPGFAKPVLVSSLSSFNDEQLLNIVDNFG